MPSSAAVSSSPSVGLTRRWPAVAGRRRDGELAHRVEDHLLVLGRFRSNGALPGSNAERRPVLREADRIAES